MSSEKDSKIYLQDILESSNKIAQYTEGISFHDFLNNDILKDAVIRNPEIIGKAVKRSTSGLSKRVSFYRVEEDSRIA